MPDRFAISAETVVPMNGPPIDHGAVIVLNAKIESVVPKHQLPSGIECDDYPDSLLLPAFVNAHTHLVLTAFRGMADDVDLFTWLADHVLPLDLDRREDECRASAAAGVEKCFRNGITAVAEQHYTTWGRDAMHDAGMKGIFFYEVFGLGTLDLTRSTEGHRELIEKFAGEATNEICFGVAPHAPYTVTPPMARMACEMAWKYDLPMTTHIAETREEVEFFLHGTGRFSTARRGARYPTPDGKHTSVDYFNDLGLLTENTLIVHGVHLSDSDLNIISDIKCPMLTCPTSNSKLGVGIARVGAWVNHGLNVCIGTDSAASGETFDLFEEMRRFVLMQRGLTGELDQFSAEDVLRMVTTNPAKAMGMSDMIGDLREGSCADLLLVQPDLEGVIKYRDPYGTLLWDVKSENIRKVWSDGQEVYSK